MCLSLFSSSSASIHYNSFKVCKIHSFSDSRKIAKMLIVHHHHLSTPHSETGISNRSYSYTKIIYTGAILDAQNLHTKIFIPKLSCNLTSVTFRRHFLVWSRDVSFGPVFITLFRALCWLRCSFVSVSLND